MVKIKTSPDNSSSGNTGGALSTKLDTLIDSTKATTEAVQNTNNTLKELSKNTGKQNTALDKAVKEMSKQNKQFQKDFTKQNKTIEKNLKTQADKYQTALNKQNKVYEKNIKELLKVFEKQGIGKQGLTGSVGSSGSSTSSSSSSGSGSSSKGSKVRPGANEVTYTGFGILSGIDPAAFKGVVDSVKLVHEGIRGMFGLIGSTFDAIKQDVKDLWNIGTAPVKGAWNLGKKGAKKIGGLFGASKKGSSADTNQEEDYGSAVKANDPISKKLDTIINLLKKMGGSNGDTPEEKKEGGFFSELLKGLLGPIMGIGKMLLPLVAGSLINMIKPWIDKLFSKIFTGLFGNETLGNVLGGILGDMLPGAVMGYAYSKLVFGKPSWGAVVIGAGLSLAYYTIKDKVEQIIGIFNGEPKEITAEGYLDMAMRGALVGAALTKFGAGSGKAALLGAGIGVVAEWVTNRVQDIKSMWEGNDVEIKEWGGISEATWGGLIAGGLLGWRFGGPMGAVFGGILGAAVGTLETAIADYNNRLHAANNGDYVEPKTIGPFSYSAFTGLLAGGLVGWKTGGPLGFVLGAILGGLAGWIMGKIQDYKLGKKASQKKANDAMAKNEDFKQMDAEKAEREAKLKDPNISDAEKTKLAMQNANATKVKQQALDAAAGFSKWDKDNDGVLSDDEAKALDEAYWKSGNSLLAKRTMIKLKEQGKPLTLDNFMKYYSDLGTAMNETTEKMFSDPAQQTSSQIMSNSTTETNMSLIQSNKELAEQMCKMNEHLENGDLDNNITIAEGGQSQISAYSTGAASVSSMG